MKRTPTQNSALHLYFRRLAEALNDSGYDLQKVMEQKTVAVPWNERMIKEILWRQLQEVITGKGSTTELTSGEVNRVYEVLDRHIAENFGLSVPFPSDEDGSQT